MWLAGTQNNLCDVLGIRVGHAHDAIAKSGTTVIQFDRPAVASVSIIGQAPGTREMAALDPSRTVEAIDALVLSGGSAFGLAAIDPVVAHLASAGRGFAVGDVHVPIVPGAILFDLTNGGAKPSDLTSLYHALGKQALGALTDTPGLGAVGAGFGATTGAGTGGLGMASCMFDETAPDALRGKTVSALVAVNAVGSPFIDDTDVLRAWPFELGGEFGNKRPIEPTRNALIVKTLARPGQNTTIGLVATDVRLDKRQCHSLAIAGQDGLTAALFPAHTSLDGDLVVAASTATDGPMLDPITVSVLQAAGTATMARAIGRGIQHASIES